MAPGQALCQVCPSQASLSEGEGGLGIQCDGAQLDGTFWAGATSNVTNCCAALVPSLEFFEQPADAADDAAIFQSRNAWLYDNLLTCTGIRTVYPVP